LSVDDYLCSVGIGRGTRTYIDVRVASYLVSELSIKLNSNTTSSTLLL